MNKAKISPTTIYCLGPSGTFSVLAAELFAAGRLVKLSTVKTISEVFQKIADQPDAFGVLPIENTIAGVVGVHQDLLVEYRKHHNLTITAEIYCDIRFGLLANNRDLSKISFIYAHPHAFEQCQLFKINHMPNAQMHFVKSTIAAGKEFLKATTKKNDIAAIVPLTYILQDETIKNFYTSLDYPQGIQDSSVNITRFFILKKSSDTPDFDFSKQKTSIFIESLKDESALLHRILTPFANLRLNLSFLHSRSSLDNPWTYNFFLDFYNNQEHANDTKLLLDTLNRFDAIKVMVLGSYNGMMGK